MYLPYINTCVCVFVHIYIYIYIHADLSTLSTAKRCWLARNRWKCSILSDRVNVGKYVIKNNSNNHD